MTVPALMQNLIDAARYQLGLKRAVCSARPRFFFQIGLLF